jgi:hypothetical protein
MPRNRWSSPTCLATAHPAQLDMAALKIEGVARSRNIMSFPLPTTSRDQLAGPHEMFASSPIALSPAASRVDTAALLRIEHQALSAISGRVSAPLFQLSRFPQAHGAEPLAARPFAWRREDTSQLALLPPT